MLKKEILKKYLEIYEKMLLIRRFEEKAGQLYGMGKIVDFVIYILDKKRLL
jgi:pyruvate dehydrogenase E1 component alpha subunit